MRTPTVVGAALVLVFGPWWFAPAARAQEAPPSPALVACEGALVAAGVGSSGTSRQVWLPAQRQFNFHVGTPEIKVGGRAASVTIPSFTIFDTKVFSHWNGARYVDSSRVNTFGPWTWTDRAIQGVCVSYDTAIADFLRNWDTAVTPAGAAR